MKKEIADLWVQALRSGEYQQTEGTLHDPGAGFCCLGVLCDVHRKTTGEGEWDEDGAYRTGRYSASGVLPTAVINWSGVADSNPDTPLVDSDSSNGKASLATLNDDEGYTFAQIADVIEQHWESL